MRQTLTLPLDGFARQTLQATADRHHLAPADIVAAAARYFLDDRDRGRPARLLPDFARPEPPAGDCLELDLDLDDETWEHLSEEAGDWLLDQFLSTELMRNGLICRADDRGDPVIQLSPPLIAGPAEFAEMEGALRPALEAASEQLHLA